jgi:hypothetical protein
MLPQADRRPAAAPAQRGTKTRLDRAGKHKTATYHEDDVTLAGHALQANDRPLRQ